MARNAAASMSPSPAPGTLRLIVTSGIYIPPATLPAAGSITQPRLHLAGLNPFEDRVQIGGADAECALPGQAAGPETARSYPGPHRLHVDAEVVRGLLG